MSFGGFQDQATSAAGGQGGAYPIPAGVSQVRFTTVGAGEGTVLPANAPGGVQISIRNDGGNTLQVFPEAGAKINGGVANASVNILATQAVEFTKTGQLDTNWATFSNLQPAVFTEARGLVAQNTLATNGLQLANGAIYNEISTCASGANSVLLPLNPTLNQNYRIQNNGVFPARIFIPFAGTANTATINGISLQSGGAGTTENRSWWLAPGNYVDMYATALAATGNTWRVGSSGGKGIVVRTQSAAVDAAESALSLTALDNGHYFLVLKVGVNRAVTIPSAATCVGCNYTFKNEDKSNFTVTYTPAAGQVAGGVICNDQYAGLAAANTCLFVGNAEVEDMFTLMAAGANWQLQGITNANLAGIKVNIA